MISWSDVRREPFRIFFPLAVVFGVVGVGHWLVYEIGWTKSYSGSFHAHVQTWGYIGSFVVGFLFTALPRSGGGEPATTLEVAFSLLLLIAGAAAAAFEAWILAGAMVVLWLVVVALFAVRRIPSRGVAPAPPAEFVWIPLALALGLAGMLLSLAGRLDLTPAWAVRCGELMARQGFPLGVVLGVGGFLAPRLLGHGGGVVPAGNRPAERAARLRARRVRIHCAAAAGLLASFLIEANGSVRWAYLLRGGIVTAELLWTTRLHRHAPNDSLFANLLRVSLGMTGAGLLAAGALPNARVAMLHLTFIGGLALMTFAMATMVLLSHSGDGERLGRPLPVLRFVGAGLAFALLARVSADAHLDTYFRWLAAAAVGWLIAGCAWLAFAAARLLQAPSADAFERAHEEAKARILRAAGRGSGRTPSVGVVED